MDKQEQPQTKILFVPCEFCGDGDPSTPCKHRENIEKGCDCIQRVDP